MPSHTRDIQFHYMSLFSQDLHSLEPILAKTSCMNPEDGELVGLIEIMIQRVPKDSDRYKRLEALSNRFQIMGMSKWMKGELTHLGLRLGHRNKQDIDLSSDIPDEDNGTVTS